MVTTSTKVWKDHSSDVDIYRVLASPAAKRRALEKGYLSPWLIRRFEHILADVKTRHEDYENAKAQLGITQTKPAQSAPLPAPTGRTPRQVAPVSSRKLVRAAGV